MCLSNLGGEEIAVNVLSSACILSLQQGRQYGPVTVQSVRQAAVFFNEIPVFEICREIFLRENGPGQGTFLIVKYSRHSPMITRHFVLDNCASDEG